MNLYSWIIRLSKYANSERIKYFHNLLFNMNKSWVLLIANDLLLSKYFISKINYIYKVENKYIYSGKNIY